MGSRAQERFEHNVMAPHDPRLRLVRAQANLEKIPGCSCCVRRRDYVQADGGDSSVYLAAPGLLAALPVETHGNRAGPGKTTLGETPQQTY